MRCEKKEAVEENPQNDQNSLFGEAWSGGGAGWGGTFVFFFFVTFEILTDMKWILRRQ